MKKLLTIILLFFFPFTSFAAISATNVTTNQNGVGATSYATASVTPNSNKLELLCVGNQVSSGTPNTPTVTGDGLTWVQVATKLATASGLRRATLFRALGTPSTGALTIDMAGQTQVRAGWSWAELSGTDTTGTNGSGALVQSGTGEQTDVGSSTGLTVTLAGFSSVSNATYGCLRYGGSETTDNVQPGSGFSTIGIVNGSASYQSQFEATNNTSVSWTWNSGSLYSEGIAAEIKASGAVASTFSPWQISIF